MPSLQRKSLTNGATSLQLFFSLMLDSVVLNISFFTFKAIMLQQLLDRLNKLEMLVHATTSSFISTHFASDISNPSGISSYSQVSFFDGLVIIHMTSIHVHQLNHLLQIFCNKHLLLMFPFVSNQCYSKSPLALQFALAHSVSQLIKLIDHYYSISFDFSCSVQDHYKGS